MPNLNTFRATEDHIFEESFIYVNGEAIFLDEVPELGIESNSVPRIDGGKLEVAILSYLHARDERLLQHYRENTRVEEKTGKHEFIPGHNTCHWCGLPRKGRYE